jgi:hypothetical protein
MYIFISPLLIAQDKNYSWTPLPVLHWSVDKSHFTFTICRIVLFLPLPQWSGRMGILQWPPPGLPASALAFFSLSLKESPKWDYATLLFNLYSFASYSEETQESSKDLQEQPFLPLWLYFLQLSISLASLLFLFAQSHLRASFLPLFPPS